jgi:hypothetical protein
MLSKLFEVLDTPETERGSKLDADLARFDCINGKLFHERLPLPDFDGAMREKLLYACSFNWEKISPAIFGSLFQSVMDKVARRRQGAHYRQASIYCKARLGSVSSPRIQSRKARWRSSGPCCSIVTGWRSPSRTALSRG